LGELFSSPIFVFNVFFNFKFSERQFQMKQILIWGAGKIGRGFVAQLFSEARYSLVFVDQDKSLVERLRSAGSYPVQIVAADGSERTVTISGFETLHTEQAELVTAAVAKSALIAVAVPAAALADAARGLVAGVAQRSQQAPDSSQDIILCVNSPHPGPEFRALLAQELPATELDYLAQKIGIV